MWLKSFSDERTSVPKSPIFARKFMCVLASLHLDSRVRNEMSIAPNQWHTECVFLFLQPTKKNNTKKKCRRNEYEYKSNFWSRIKHSFRSLSLQIYCIDGEQKKSPGKKTQVSSLLMDFVCSLNVQQIRFWLKLTPLVRCIEYLKFFRFFFYPLLNWSTQCIWKRCYFRFYYFTD